MRDDGRKRLQSGKRDIWSLLVMVLALVVWQGCSNRPAEDPATHPLAPVTLRVVNDNWLHVNVYLMCGAARHRLGTVTSMGRRLFPIPDDLYRRRDHVHFLVKPVGSSDTFLSQEVPVRRGDYMTLTVMEPVKYSRIMIN